MKRTARLFCCTVTAASLWLSGCRHAPAKVASVPAPPSISPGPVMVSVPPPTHRSTGSAEEASITGNIPVVKPVPPPKKPVRRSTPASPTASPQAVANVAPPPPAATATPMVQSLGRLTTDNDNPGATRDGAAQAVRTQQNRLGGLSSATQTAHVSEVDQVRRFLKSAADSWNAADYAAALTLATKAKVLLDDLLK